MHNAVEQITGFAEAVQLYGQPQERVVRQEIREATGEFWDLSRRKRTAEVVMVIRRPSRRYLVHTKAFYPKGVYRLLSGGVKAGEHLLDALRREVAEETGLSVSTERFLAWVRYEFIWAEQSMPFASYVFLLDNREGGNLTIEDSQEEITHFREVRADELTDMGRELDALPPDWRDWGRFRAVTHYMVADLLGAEHGRP